MKKFLLTISVLLLWGTLSATSSPLWLRYPSISPDGKQIAFCYKGDIYKVSINGGTAIRLTTNPAYESTPIWSPDGRTIAFTSDREGGYIDIYTMSSDGGAAKRITTHSGTETPYTFTPDGKYIVFSSHIEDPAKSALFPAGNMTELYKVGIDGGAPEMILATPAEYVNFNKDGTKFLYQDLKGFENEWRKHHTSSVTRDIWEYDLKKKTHTKLIDWKGEDRNPVYVPDKNELYFLSERSGSFNLFSAPLDNPSSVKQLTKFKTHPLRFLSISGGGMVCFGYDGEIYTMTSGSSPKKVAISIVNDIVEEQLTTLNSSRGATYAVASPDGKQVAMIIRGDVFVTSVEYPTTKQITETVSAEKGLSFGADNRTLAYASDRSGCWNIYLAKIDREADLNFPNATTIKEEALFGADNIERMDPSFSPDGKELAFIQDRSKLMVINLETKKVRQITDGSTQHESSGSFDYEWSPDGKWFALEFVARNHAPYSDIGIVSAAGNGKIFNITNSGYINGSPHWVMDGNAIIFASERFGMRNHASWGSQMDEIIVFMNREAMDKYRMSAEEYDLYKEGEKNAKKNEKKEDKSKADEKKSDKKENKKEDSVEKEKVKEIVIEFDNMVDRIVRLTPNSSNLGDAMMDKEGSKLYYMVSFESGFDMWVIDLRKGSAKLLNKLDGGWASLQLDKEGKNLFLLGGSSLQKMSIAGERLSGISYRAEMKLDLAKEREIMYDVVCQEEQKRFYEVKMHGVDWGMLTKSYRKFLPHIDNNYDFSEMLSELLGELNVSHTGSGYRAARHGDATASLGLFFAENRKEAGLLIEEIVVNGPLDNFQSKVKAGNIIEKIDGTVITPGMDYYPLLNGKAGKKVLISVYDPATKTRWDEVVKPVSMSVFNSLLYSRWVKQREADVERLSGGRLGYVHIPSMGDDSFRTVYSDVLGKYYDKEGIVIDIRYNGGGRLHEDLETFFSGKKYLTQVVRGKDYCDMPSRRWTKPSIMIITEADYSNAHGTPWVYKTMGIGRLVGMPVPGTMTSVNWVTLQDPSLYFGIPIVGYRTAQGAYLENSQIEPDVEVALDPVAVVNGEDAQLAAAVRELLKELKTK